MLECESKLETAILQRKSKAVGELDTLYGSSLATDSPLLSSFVGIVFGVYLMRRNLERNYPMSKTRSRN